VESLLVLAVESRAMPTIVLAGEMNRNKKKAINPLNIMNIAMKNPLKADCHKLENRSWEPIAKAKKRMTVGMIARKTSLFSFEK
jgi:hypothetical protein